MQLHTNKQRLSLCTVHRNIHNPIDFFPVAQFNGVILKLEPLTSESTNTIKVNTDAMHLLTFDGSFPNELLDD